MSIILNMKFQLDFSLDLSRSLWSNNVGLIIAENFLSVLLILNKMCYYK
jgi:hypothetical protein